MKKAVKRLLAGFACDLAALDGVAGESCWHMRRVADTLGLLSREGRRLPGQPRRGPASLGYMMQLRWGCIPGVGRNTHDFLHGSFG